MNEIDYFYQGILGPIADPGHLMLLFAAGLFLGQRGIRNQPVSLAIFLLSTLIGLVIAYFSLDLGVDEYKLLFSAILALLVAADLSLSIFLISFVVAIAGVTLGVGCTQDSVVNEARWIVISGGGISIYLVALYLMTLIEYFKSTAWFNIGVRVIGSWIAASSIMVLVFTLSTRA